MKKKKIIYVIVQFIIIISAIFILPVLNTPGNIILLIAIIVGSICNLAFLCLFVKRNRHSEDI
jgi:hypothetical protein